MYIPLLDSKDRLQRCRHTRSGGGEDVGGFLLGDGNECLHDAGVKLGSTAADQAPTNVQDFNSALTANGLIDGGVMYFGHSGKYHDPASGVLFSALFVGQDPIANENMWAGNVATLSNAQLGPNAAIWLNGCEGGADAPGGSSIAQLISNQLHRGVYAYEGGTYFSASNAANDKSINGIGLNAPPDLPVYMVPEGTPGKKPPYVPFTPY